MVLNRSENADRLVKMIREGLAVPRRAPVLWVGAGASIPSGYPSWAQLGERLREKSLREVDHIVRHCNLDVAYRAPPACAGLIPAGEIEAYHPDEQQLLPWEDIEVLENLRAAEGDDYCE